MYICLLVNWPECCDQKREVFELFILIASGKKEEGLLQRASSYVSVLNSVRFKESIIAGGDVSLGRTGRKGEPSCE